MAVTQSGYLKLSNYSDIRLQSNPTVPGSTVQIWGGLLRGPTETILLDVARRFNATVEKLVQGWGNWGFDPNHTQFVDNSNHGSGTAMDLNASHHPIGSGPEANFSAAQIKEIRRIVAWYQGVVRWGGDYYKRKDPMHFEINDNLSGSVRIIAVSNMIIRAPVGPGPTPIPAPPAKKEDDDMPLNDDDVKKIWDYIIKKPFEGGTQAKVWQILGDIMWHARRAALPINTNAIAAATAKILGPKLGTVSAAELTAALKKALDGATIDTK